MKKLSLSNILVNNHAGIVPLATCLNKTVPSNVMSNFLNLTALMDFNSPSAAQLTQVSGAISRVLSLLCSAESQTPGETREY